MTNAWRGETEGADLPIFGTGRDSVAGFDDPALSDAGVDVADALAFHGQRSPDAPTRMEMLPVVLSGELWSVRNGAGNLVVGQMRDRNTTATVAPRSSDATSQWLGFALIGKGRHDIRPDLLALVWQHNLIGVERCIRYGANYLLASGHRLGMDLLQAAAADALLILVYGETRGDGVGRKRADGSYTVAGQVKRHRPRRPTLHQRERQFKLGNGEWAYLRDAALKAYRRRFREAVALFAHVDNWRPTSTGRSFAHGFAESAWLPDIAKLELAGPMAHLFHMRNPTVPPTDWMSGRGRLTSPIAIMICRRIDTAMLHLSRAPCRVMHGHFTGNP